MDLILLRHLVAELGTVIRGARIDQIYALPRRDLALVMGLPGSPRLWFSSEPAEPHLYLRPGRQPAPKRPPGFAMALRKRARGRCVSDLRLINDDRVVELTWHGDGSRLVMELVARRASAFVINPDNCIVAVWSPRRGRPTPGQAYEPPITRSRRTRLGDVDFSRLEELPEQELRRSLLREVKGMTPLLAREISSRRLDGQALVEATRLEYRRALEEPPIGHLYSAGPLEELHSLPPSNTLVLAPYELASAQRGMCVARFPTLRAAASKYYRVRARLRLLDRIRRAVEQPLRTKSRRLQRAVRRLETELPNEKDSITLRREGDLLLAHPTAEVAGEVVHVPDDYAGSDLIDIRIDPGLDLIANAQQRYRRAKRISQKREHGIKRLVELRRQLEALGELADLTQAMRGLSACNKVIRRLHQLIPTVRISLPLEPEAGTSTSPDTMREITDRTARARLGPGILRLTTYEGDVILVGRNASANDRLTHHLANRDDWWLHADGPGSHVLLRNPQKLKNPPPKALEHAARIAAWFSKARSAAMVEVHWTRASSVKRAKGGTPGQAVIKGQRSIRVEPRQPVSSSASSRIQGGSSDR